MMNRLNGVALALSCTLGLTQACVVGVERQPGDEDRVARTTQALEANGNATGTAESAHVDGVIDRDGAFFQPIGTLPGRTCEHCHFAEAGWSITPALVQRIFDESDGLHPMFSTHDMGARIDADVSTRAAREETFRTALERGLTRFTVCAGGVALPLCGPLVVPDGEFDIIAVDDPTGFSTPQVFSLFRHPTATANVTFMPTLTASLQFPLAAIAPFSAGAASFHLLAPAPTEAQATDLGDFQLGHFFAQSIDAKAGPLDAAGASGGPDALLALSGQAPLAPPSDGWVFDLFDAWAGADEHEDADSVDEARAAIARGQDLFNFRRFGIAGVAGLNDEHGVEILRGSCTTCHDRANVGSHSDAAWMNIGTSDPTRRWKELPLLTVQDRATGEVMEVPDLGLGATTGLWNDIGKFRVPQLRGLVSRAPYFHDGSAASLDEALEHHEARFRINLRPSDREDLLAFLRAL